MGDSLDSQRGSALVCAPIGGPEHERGEVSEEGFFCGIQWPAVMVKRKSDDKIFQFRGRRCVCVNGNTRVRWTRRQLLILRAMWA